MTRTICKECIDIVKELVEHEFLYFDTAIEVKVTSHSFPFNAWAACVSPKNELFVMDSDEQWHEVELTNDNAALVIENLYHRLKWLRIKFAKAG